MRKLSKLGLAILIPACLGLAFPGSASAQSKTFRGEDYAITFGDGWDTVTTRNILGKFGGINGMATLNVVPGTALPNIDSISLSIADSLGGSFKKDSSGVKTLGPYEVHWQKFAYDSLPKLSAQVSKASGFPVNLKNGSLRVYFLTSDGFTFTMAGMAIIPRGTPPYKDIELAIATLKLGAQAGIRRVSRVGGRDLWIREGRLGGSWLKANRVFAVECFDARGSLIGAAVHGIEGSWVLPVSRQDMIVRLQTAVGPGLHFVVRP